MVDKILYTATSYPPAIGGAQLHTHQIARRISTRRPVQVITHWAENRTDWLLGTTLRAPAEPHSYTIDNIPVEQITLTSAERWRLAPYVLGYYALKSPAIDNISEALLPKIEPLAHDCALIHNVRIGREPLSFASLKAARKLDVPFIFVPNHHPRWVGWNYRDYLNLYRQADALIVFTQTEKQTLVDLGVREERIFITGIGPILADEPDPQRFRSQLDLPADVPLILFLGQKYKYKGIDLLLSAAEIVWQSQPEARFLFIGPRTPYSKKIFAQYDDPRLIELDTVDLQQKTDALAACTIFCLPSSQESFGGVYTEAWSFEKPVIGLDIPAIREVIDEGQNGYLISASPELLAERLNYLLQNPQVAQELGRAGNAKVLEKYTWDRLAQKTEGVYTTTLGRATKRKSV